jgi:hypothetical protein
MHRIIRSMLFIEKVTYLDNNQISTAIEPKTPIINTVTVDEILLSFL